MKPRDMTGREIFVGDTLKIFHFIGVRKKKHYMYKYVSEIVVLGEKEFYRILHLTPSGDYFHMKIDGVLHDGIEIVQGFCENGLSFENRKKTK